MSDAEAFGAFEALRWESNGGGLSPLLRLRRLLRLPDAPAWKCNGCGHPFSVTSDTTFASRKLPMRI